VSAVDPAPGAAKPEQIADTPHPRHASNISEQGSIYWKIPPQGGREYQPMSFGRKNMKRRREKGGKCKRKRGKKMRKGEVKG
jgi:hypothetical protein